ncbi:sensor histidine kinase [Streptococcus equi subsp. zooepidemicus ATCC 35246]|nr:sensor histidine kinase [Streptococcus equi subsp. zooepidemicus ATCC 35246]
MAIAATLIKNIIDILWAISYYPVDPLVPTAWFFYLTSF